MSIDKLNSLKNKVLGSTEASSGEILVSLARELHCLPEIIGRDYEVYDRENKLLYRIKQKPMKLIQLNELLKLLHKLNKRENKALKKGRKK